MCDGWTLDEIVEDQAAVIEQRGWVLQAVDARRPWILQHRTE
jgi:hypothetical protein